MSQGRPPTPDPPTKNFYALDDRLQALGTKVVYIGIARADGQRSWWDLHGSQMGKQGVVLAPQVFGLFHNPFEQLFSEGPYQVGAHYERTDYQKREVNIQVHINVGKPDTIFRYRMIEQRWWESWSAKDEGYLGVFTRTHGWRFLKVRLAESPKTQFELDPQAYDNNFMSWDMNIVATQPYWAKRTEVATWKNLGEGDGGIPQTPWEELQEYLEDLLEATVKGMSSLIPGMTIGEGNLVLPNRSSIPVWPKFLVSSPGIACIQDGPGGPMIELPLLTPDDGVILVDTDPTARTLTAATDPVDPLFMRLARNSALLDFILHDILVSTMPVWRRFYGRFTTPWPAQTICRIKVQHTNAGAQVSGLMPQLFERAWG